MLESNGQGPDEQSVDVHIDYLPFVNFGMQQNAVPLLRSVIIENKTPKPLADVRARIWSDPPVFAKKTMRVDTIPAGAQYAVNDHALTLLREPLRKQLEREEGHLWIEIATSAERLYKAPFALSILAYNEWCRMPSLPEIIAAHVLPNDPAVEQVLAAANKLLRENDQEASLSGYQRNNPRHVYTQIAAIYWAATHQQISYVNPPASFEETGQKIRTPTHLLAHKLGTCLDTTTFLAACFEQAGLRPAVVLVEGHSFVGVWLVDKSFDNPVSRHASVLLNRIDMGEFIALESTGITKTPPTGFKTAREQAIAHLRNEGEFHYAVDIESSRKIGIKPLSLAASVTETAGNNNCFESLLEKADEKLFAPTHKMSAPPFSAKGQTRGENVATRLERWKTNLLDLSLRNRLLNFKETKKSIPILCPDIASLEDALADGLAFRVRPLPTAWRESDPRDQPLHQDQTGEDAFGEYLRDGMGRQRLHASLAEREVAARLTQVERAARLGMEEGGANTLYLVLGFLVWTESETSDVERRAPILLLPMRIERKSIREGFRIRKIDDECRINITLLQKLQTDFGIKIDDLDPLPEDDSGLDVPRILRAIRDAIKREPRWKVVEEACLSILTFSRFLMWLDLEVNAETLKKNAIVRHLVETPNEVFDPGAVFPDLETLDEQYPPAASFCPLPADSSQLRAVFAAAKGHSFVLQGPPGTGKSQTIANLIAHCLTVGKRVLFVAQKRAALDVVHRRLTHIGLGPFCLELHSNKSTREAFRKQIREVLSLSAVKSGTHWDRETAKLTALRKELNAYVQSLHRPRAFGKSAYWAISTLIGFEGRTKVPLNLGEPADQTEENFETLKASVAKLTEAIHISGPPVNHPLRAVRLAEWTYGIEDVVQTAIQAAEQAHRHFHDISKAVLPQLGIPVDTASRGAFQTAGELLSLLKNAPPLTREILSVSHWPKVKATLSDWIKRGRDCAENRALLLKRYNEELFFLDLSGLKEKLTIRNGAWFFKKWQIGASVRKTAQTVRLDSKKPKDLAGLEKDLASALSVTEETAGLHDRSNMPHRLLGVLWKGLASHWHDLEHAVNWANRFRDLLDQVPDEPLETKSELKETWVRLATETSSLFSGDSPVAKKAVEYGNALQKAEETRANLDHLLHLAEQSAWGTETDMRFSQTVTKTIAALSANLTHLREWSQYQSARSDAIALQLDGLVSAIESGNIDTDNLADVFTHSFADWWVKTVLKKIPRLAGFIGERHDRNINAFRKHEAKIAALTQKEAFIRIAGSLPRMTSSGRKTPASSEAGILQRFAQGGRKTIRRIFKECPNALAKYKPCALMSPLSVAQFVGADFPKFDMVVFDEASQMPTYESIGTIARGNQLIVVGDSRQLPPTSFFERQKSDEDYEDDDLPEELESILEETEAAGIKPLRLNWHYRSRHESLIAFSNRQYYDNRLYTFPAASAEHPQLGVSWREIPEGVYEHGKSRTNRAEAKAVVAEVIRRLKDPREQKNSMGIVTFSISQQRLVEDLIDIEREAHPDLEPHFTTIEEPVFVKNLETVQGDERDVILFSICYGPDANGVIRMNFGPLNNKGGERRLNVAITRARKKLLVFSTLRPEQIDLSRTEALGVHHLRAFLKYAGQGTVISAKNVPAAEGQPISCFEQTICDALTRNGCVVDKQVGSSRYRIDLAVRDPETPGRFLLGVECDGANYAGAKSARDRDQIRQAVLKGLGWQLHRIWSMDWWLHRPREIEKLEKAIAQEKQRCNDIPMEALNAPANIPSTTAPNKQRNTEKKKGEKIRSLRETKKAAPLPGPEALAGRKTYQRYKSPAHGFSGDLHDSANAETVGDLIASIVSVEAPVLFETLCATVASCWGLQKSGPRVRKVVKAAIKQRALVIRSTEKREFVWTKTLSEQPYHLFRIPDKNDSKPRRAEEICPEEIANAAARVIKMHISMDIDDLARETANLFGIKRLGTRVRASFNEGILLLKHQGGCRMNGSSIIAS